ncbi:MAG: DUF3830 family protein [Chloroflexi bacterium]|nr:DUF3830 family protein [Chloroflexota bacterium]
MAAHCTRPSSARGAKAKRKSPCAGRARVAKQIELSLDGVIATAVLHEEEAPNTVRKVWDALPIEESLRHVRWSGSAGYIVASALRDPSFPLENRVSLYIPLTLNLRPEHGEVAISYGPAQARDGAGNGWATHFATLEGDPAAFLDAVARAQHEGKKQLVMRRKEG